MSIAPLKNGSAISPLPERPPEKRATSSQFDALLETLRPGDVPDRVEKGAVAAELLRIEMMRSSLALADAGETPPSAPSQLLADLFAHLAETRRSSSTANLAEAAGTAFAPTVGLAASADPSAAASAEITRTAARFLGIPYRFGGEGPNGIDCSSFVQQVYREHGINLPRTAREQSKVGKDVPVGDLREGDLLFFHTYASYPSHVGIYLGEGKMIHASSGSGKVVVSEVDSDYYRSRFIGAKRVA